MSTSNARYKAYSGFNGGVPGASPQSIVGTGNPSATPEDNDSIVRLATTGSDFLDTATGNLYYKNSSGVWALVVAAP